MTTELKVFVETDDGQRYLRFQENRLDRAYTEIVSDFQSSDTPGETAYYSDVESGVSVLYENFEITNAMRGFAIYGAGARDIYNYEFVEANSVVNGDNLKYGNGIRLSGSDTDLYDIDAPITMQRVYADGQNRPLPFEGGYSSSNKDFITNDNEVKEGETSAPVFVRDFTAMNFSDAIVDNKGTVYLMNGTLSNAYRILRAWPGTEIVIVNSVIELGEGDDLLWISDETARVKYFNVLWNGKPQPDPALVDVDNIPSGWTKQDVLDQSLIELDRNILEDMSPFFASMRAEYSVEISVDGDAWRSVDLDPALYTKDGVIGDPKIDLPDLGNGSYRARVTATLPDGSTETDEVSYEITDSKDAYVRTAAPANEVVGSANDDTLDGSNDGETLVGGDGDDRMNGRGGEDTLYGEAGNDILIGGTGGDALMGGEGADRASYTDATASVTADLQRADFNRGTYAFGDTYDQIETLQGSESDDSLRGNSGANTLFGSVGDDWLAGRRGKDRLVGEEGDDVLVGGKGRDVLDGGTGSDRADYSDSKSGLVVDLLFETFNTGIAAGDRYISIENLRGGRKADDLRGDAGANLIEGAGGNDHLSGRDGRDELRGGAGDDVLIGGNGADLLAGSRGDDRFRFDAPGEGGDRILDFQIGRDSIVLDSNGFASLSAGGLSSSNFREGARALDSDDFILYDNGVLSYDADGNGSGAAIVIADLLNDARIDVDDFLII